MNQANPLRLLGALVASLALVAPFAAAQDNGTDPNVDIDIGDEEGEEAGGGAWWSNSTLVLLVVVLAVIVIALIVALAGRGR